MREGGEAATKSLEKYLIFGWWMMVEAELLENKRPFLCIFIHKRLRKY